MAKILFLAQFAPTNGKKVIPLSSEEKFYAETYHYQYAIYWKNMDMIM